MTTPEAASVRLRNGASVRIRPIRPDDEPRLSALYDRLGLETAFQRFFTVMRSLPPEWAHYFAHVDGVWRVAVVAERHGADGEPVLVGVGRYEAAADASDAEIALVVEDAWQAQGLGAVLLEEILRAGEAHGIHEFRAWVLADNARMRGLLARHTRIVRQQVEQGVAEIVFCRRAAAPADAA
ncbi:MAG: hypothetical protein A3I17_09260 [Candidatus Rokubacteria bacterium RIFCSPLOWO2_02_FULL_72_37]|nr:MAG: hypothetical protein A3I17_09260 [Candidatus Rokubacteria bacterium RIFCSPLOWO2_02_FULL_72_37]